MKRDGLNKKGKLIYVMAIVILINVNLHAQESDADLCHDEKGIVCSYDQLLVDTLFLCYRTYISPVNQSSCPMYPTCSGYAKECFKLNSPLIAGLKTSDRLFRCANDLDNYDTINVNGLIRYYDPVELEIKNPQVLPMGNITLLNEGNGEESSNSEKNVDGLLYWFAKQLEVNKEFKSAIIEYKRLISYYPDSIYVPRAKCDVFNILFNTGLYLEAINWGSDLLYNKNMDGIDEVDITYHISLGYFKIGNYKLSREYLSKVRSLTISNDFRDKIILLEGLSFAYEEEWEQAIAIFIDISATSDYHELALQYIDLAQQGARLKKKNPKTAAILSIIPGLGYLYCGYPKTAISSFSVNGLLMWGTKSAFEEDNRGLGIFLGGMSLGLYAGNIYGPYQTAEEKNRRMVEDHLNKFSLDFLN